MDISVVIASYNHAPYLEACIRSALDQSAPPAEVVVIDDGSTDDSREIIESFGTAVRAHFQANRGTYETLNRGISTARCDWVAIHNSDDLWRVDKLEIQAEVALRDERIGLVHTGVEYIDSSGETLDSVPGADLRNFDASACYDALPVVLRHNPVVISSVLVSRKTWERCGKFDPRFLGMGDWDFCIRAAAHSLFGFASGPLTGVRKHGASAGMDPARLPVDWNSQDWRIMLKETLPAGATALYAAAKQGSTSRSDAAVTLASVATLLARDGEGAGARKLLRLAMRLAPMRLKTHYRYLWTLLPTRRA